MYREYYFYHFELKRVLPPIFSNSEDDAWEQLAIVHSWANPSSLNCNLSIRP